MPAVCRKDMKDKVNVPSHGTPCPSIPTPCCSPSVIQTDEGSKDVIINGSSGGAGIVRKNDKHIKHPSITCPPHQTPLDSYSPNVYANNKEVGRIGDKYDTNGLFHELITGSSNVFANGH